MNHVPVLPESISISVPPSSPDLRLAVPTMAQLLRTLPDGAPNFELRLNPDAATVSVLLTTPEDRNRVEEAVTDPAFDVRFAAIQATLRADLRTALSL